MLSTFHIIVSYLQPLGLALQHCVDLKTSCRKALRPLWRRYEPKLTSGFVHVFFVLKLQEKCVSRRMAKAASNAYATSLGCGIQKKQWHGQYAQHERLVPVRSWFDDVAKKKDLK